MLFHRGAPPPENPDTNGVRFRSEQRPASLRAVTCLFLCAVSVARAEPGVAKGSAAAFARSASFFICIALLLGGFFFVIGFFVLLSMEFWRENCGLPPSRGREISCACSCGHSEPGRALSLSLLRFAILRRRARK